MSDDGIKRYYPQLPQDSGYPKPEIKLSNYHGWEVDCVFDCGHINRVIIIGEGVEGNLVQVIGVPWHHIEIDYCKRCGIKTERWTWNRGQYSKYIGKLDQNTIQQLGEHHEVPHL
jgi:hypothetical protein